MGNFRFITVLSITALLLSACGSNSAAPGDPGGPGDPGPVDPATCRVAVTSDFTVPTLLENGPEECDYYFPGSADGLVSYSVSSDVLIEAGTVLQFGQNAILYVRDEGRLTAVGAAEERIVFEGVLPVHGSWYGICFEDNRESRLEYVDVRWGGKNYGSSGANCRGGIAGMWTDGSHEPVHISDTTVSGSYVNGLSAHNLTLGEFADNAFFGNLEYGVVIPAEQVSKLDAGSDYSGVEHGAPNEQQFVYAAGSFTDPGEVHVWPALNAPYAAFRDERIRYSDSITVDDGTTLVLSPGTTIFFDGDSGLYVYGGSALGMAGTEDAPVVLTGLHNEPGSWNGVRISNSAADLRHVEIMFAGRDDMPPFEGSLAFIETGTDASEKELTNVFIDHSANCAVYVDHDDRSLFNEFDVSYGDNNEENYCGP